jgi:hypothetical protein
MIIAVKIRDTHVSSKTLFESAAMQNTTIASFRSRQYSLYTGNCVARIYVSLGDLIIPTINHLRDHVPSAQSRTHEKMRVSNGSYPK